MALSLVHRFKDRLQAQTEIDADFSDVMFSFVDEQDKDSRKRLLEDYWGLSVVSTSSEEEKEAIKEGTASTKLVY